MQKRWILFFEKQQSNWGISCNYLFDKVLQDIFLRPKAIPTDNVYEMFKHFSNNSVQEVVGRHISRVAKGSWSESLDSACTKFNYSIQAL